jgi:protein-S-isoprenylcysteine O-methyltransferase Ste14
VTAGRDSDVSAAGHDVATRRHPLLVRCGNFFFRYRDAISPAVFLALLVATRPRLLGGSLDTDRWLDIAGLLASLTGQALRIAVIGYAYIVRGGKGRKVYAEDLVTGGFFSACRNPLYVGNLLIYFGLIIVWNSPWMYAIAVPFYLFLYSSIVAAEEEFLHGKFGAAYDAYCHDVPRWVPDLRRLGAGLEGMAFNWRRVVLREYGTIVALTLTASILLIGETLYFTSKWAWRSRIIPIAIVMGIVILLWAITRWLKLSKRLRA